MKTIIVSTLHRTSDAFSNTFNKNRDKVSSASWTNRKFIHSPALPGLLTCGSFPQLGSLVGDVKERRKVPCKLCTNKFKGIMRRNRTSVLRRRRRPLYAWRDGLWGHDNWRRVRWDFPSRLLMPAGFRTLHRDVCRVLLSESCTESGPLFCKGCKVTFRLFLFPVASSK